ncbi:glycosyl transferase [Anaerocolumna cellulosilytica]|uniref:Glycosyl transferase n=1 Tax=Anaerocolumna cellulosilytica TaxID=433286 RepID=A0A6S6QRZ3_9FIRM|nr:glycosyltransferase family 2 protein [Anaerocolumna cellulosilytica]MBB5194429.1 teichuronic acid biosynthesis glycosyltransferase TuaG [Anaerocolumna cellulosilytica]BCJ93374.1 glycosyl transferase [Anaerocolumna cellulosilytica]
MSGPEVSIIIPAYNSAKYINKAIYSALAQSIEKEIIIIDDNSQDDLVSKLKDYDFAKDTIKYIKNQVNVGVAEARNIGVDASTGKYIAFLDADDWWIDTKLKRQLELISLKKAAFSYTAREIFNDNGTSTGKIVCTKEEITYKSLLYHNCVACSSVLLKRDIALRYPMKSSDVHEDYLTWLRILKDGNSAYGLNEPLLCYRLSKNGKSRNKVKSAKMTFGVHRKLGRNCGEAFFYTASHLLHNIFR